MGSFTSFWPLDDDLAWGYLYQGSPRILAMVGSKPYLRGHCAPTVAYVVNARVAKILCDFFEYEFARYDPAEYYTFEAHLQWWAMGRGAKAFIPLRHYGEHGGLPNPEHAQHGIHGPDRIERTIWPAHCIFCLRIREEANLDFFSTAPMQDCLALAGSLAVAGLSTQTSTRTTGSQNCECSP